MRVKDENKNEAIFNAIIELSNEIGLSDISMSKIAKKANISPSTLYVYFQNKDDMLKQTYLHVKTNMLGSFTNVMDKKLSAKETIALFMRELLNYYLVNPAYFLFLEQFENTPFVSKMGLRDKILKLTEVYSAFLENGRAQGILKNLDVTLLAYYCYFPVLLLAKENICHDYVISDKSIEQVIEMSWDAIKSK